MNKIKELFFKLPILFQSIIWGALLLNITMTLIQYLTVTNVTLGSMIPWSLIFTIPILYHFYKFTSGREGFYTKSDWRQRYAYFKPIPKNNRRVIVFLSIGLFLFIFSVFLIGFSFFDRPTLQIEFLSFINQAPTLTAICLLAILACAAGLIEEVVFRGYIQELLRERYNIFVALIVSSVLFTLVHFLPGPLIITYLIVSFAFGITAYLSQSIWPTIIVHAIFDFVAFLMVYFFPDLTSGPELRVHLQAYIIILILSILIFAFVIMRIRKQANIHANP